MQQKLQIAQFKYETNNHSLVWLFDQCSCHRKFHELALQAKYILVKDGGTRRVCDTIWAGQPQNMVKEDGTVKGLRTILRESGITTERMLADDMRVVLPNHEDFITERTILEHYLYDKGQKAFFLPKFHCELNTLERVWAQAKVYC